MPKVSIIVPCYNEQNTIGHLLEAIYHQTYPLSDIEVIIADGNSEDGTLGIIKGFQTSQADLCIKIINNSKRIIPAALNCAINGSRGEIIIRLDAHSIPSHDYVELCVKDLEAGLGDNIGGVWDIKPGGTGIIAKSIALSASHPIAVGDARYRYTSKADWVDTVPFGAFYRSLIDKIGYFDETLLTNEDYEFNVRIRKNGGNIWLNPKIRSVYFSRKNYLQLAKQYWRYGFWKMAMLKRYSNTIRWRQALPPLFLCSLLFLLILSIWYYIARFLFIIQISLYILILIVGALPLAIKEKDIRLLFSVPLAIATMHLSWGAGFIIKMLSTIFSKPQSYEK